MIGLILFECCEATQGTQHYVGPTGPKKKEGRDAIVESISPNVNDFRVFVKSGVGP